MPCPVWPRATPSPTRSPCRMAGQSATCNTPANGLFAWWANRRGVASRRRPRGQESLHGHRPCQVAVRGSVPLRRLAPRRGYCTPLRCAHRPQDVPGELRCSAPRELQQGGGESPPPPFLARGGGCFAKESRQAGYAQRDTLSTGRSTLIEG